MFNFIASNRQAQEWLSVGSASSFPNITESEALQKPISCVNGSMVGCKIFQVSNGDSHSATQLASSMVEDSTVDSQGLQSQVLVFQYKNKFHAMDNQCPHSSFPLSNGMVFDIEDFGIALSAGITCPKHGWSFDLFTGRSDRASYKLRLWEVQLRPATGDSDENGQEVWIRKKQRIG